MRQTTLMLIKPDAVRRDLIGAILRKVESSGMHIDQMHMGVAKGKLIDAHYAEHVNASYYPAMRTFMKSGPLVSVAVDGTSAIALLRGIVGPTKGNEGRLGQLRYDLYDTQAHPIHESLAHASDSVESAHRELALWFPKCRLCKHDRAGHDGGGMGACFCGCDGPC